MKIECLLLLLISLALLSLRTAALELFTHSDQLADGFAAAMDDPERDLIVPVCKALTDFKFSSTEIR